MVRWNEPESCVQVEEFFSEQELIKDFYTNCPEGILYSDWKADLIKAGELKEFPNGKYVWLK